MVAKIQELVDEYEKRLHEMPFFPRVSYRRRMLREDGGPNRDFLSFLFCDDGFAMQFLKDVGLLRIKVQCDTCGRDMTWSAEPSVPERFRWRSRRKIAGVKCSESKSINAGTWFRQSNLVFREVLLVTYYIVSHETARRTKEVYGLRPITVADWGMFCRETMLVFMAGCSEKLGSPNKIVEIEESKFGRRKYFRVHPVKGKWVFGGVERDSGRTFLVPVPDRTSDTLVIIKRDWIEPGTTIISDNWAAYRNLESQGFTHRTMNHFIQLVDPDTGAHTNKIESNWRAVTVFLGKAYTFEILCSLIRLNSVF